MLSGRLPMREVRAWGKRLAYDGMFRDTLHHIMTDGDSRMAENAAWIFTYADTDVLPSLPSHYVDTWMERVMNTRRETLRRLLLTLISRTTSTYLHVMGKDINYIERKTDLIFLNWRSFRIRILCEVKYPRNTASMLPYTSYPFFNFPKLFPIPQLLHPEFIFTIPKLFCIMA